MKRTLISVLISLGITLGLLVFCTTQPTFGTGETPEGHAAAAETGLQIQPGRSSTATLAQPETVTMVVVPSADAEPIARAAEQVAALLEKETGYRIYAFVTACFGAAVDTLATKEADVGWLPPTTYVLAHDNFGIDVKLATERNGSSAYRGQFLVRSDSGINDLADLAGTNFAFVDPLSTSGYMYPAVQISNTQGITYAAFFSETVFAGSHSDAVRAVYNGEHGGTPIHGGAMYEDARWAIVDEYPDVFSQTEVIAYTGLIPNDTVSVRPGIDAVVSQQVISGLLTIADTQEGQQALYELYSIDGLAPTDDVSYDIVRNVVAAFGLEFESCSEATNVTSDLGGSLSYVDTNGLTTTVQIPQEAVTETLQISYTPIPAITYRPAGLIEIGRSFDLRAVVSGTLQTVSSLPVPYTITVIYADSQVRSVGEGSLALYYWDQGQWAKEPSGAVNADNNTLIATPNHFSRWTVLGIPKVFLPLVLKHR